MRSNVPVCINCGGHDFVWADTLHTGGLGRRTLSLRARGVLPLGTRLCRGCGHADLFLKDSAALKDLPPGAEGEFQPMSANAEGATPAASPAPTPPPSAGTPPTAWSEEAEPPAAEPKKPPRRRAPPKGRATTPPLILD